MLSDGDEGAGRKGGRERGDEEEAWAGGGEERGEVRGKRAAGRAGGEMDRFRESEAGRDEVGVSRLCSYVSTGRGAGGRAAVGEGKEAGRDRG